MPTEFNLIYGCLFNVAHTIKNLIRQAEKRCEGGTRGCWEVGIYILQYNILYFPTNCTNRPRLHSKFIDQIPLSPVKPKNNLYFNFK